MSNELELYQETFELPSRGIPYAKSGVNIPSSITLRGTTVNEDKLRFTSSSFIRTMSQIIKACIVTSDSVDIEELVAPDFTYLMYMLRMISVDKDYKVTLTCPDCEKDFSVVVDLSNLNIEYLNEEFEEPIEIELPVSKDVLGIRLMRISDMLWVEREAKILRKKYKDYQGDPQYVLRLEAYINTVNGEKLRQLEKHNYVSKMSSRDASYITYNLNKIQFGIEEDMIEICPHCGEEVTYSLPFNEEFFRPSFES